MNEYSTDSTWAVTVSVTVGEVTLPSLALIEVEPTTNPTANPWEAAALLIAAMFTSEDAQVTDVVKIWVELSV